MSDKKTTSDKSKRPKRIPLHVQKKLGFAERPGYVRRLVNDVGDRIERYKLAGWTHVLNQDENDISDINTQKGSSERSPVKVIVNEGLDAKAKYGYLLEIEEELFNEDRDALRAKRKESTEDRINPSKDSHQYGGIKYK